MHTILTAQFKFTLRGLRLVDTAQPDVLDYNAHDHYCQIQVYSDKVKTGRYSTTPQPQCISL